MIHLPKHTSISKMLSLLLLLAPFHIGICQQMNMRPLQALIDEEDPGWVLVQAWIDAAQHPVEVLGRDLRQAEQALYRVQVTTRSPMGAIVYETGGILVDDGWIRILGAGSDRLKRSLPAWNKGKSFDRYGQVPGFLLVAEDAIGGFFALNGGALGAKDRGSIYYFSPDALQWEPLDIGYSDFIRWTFSGDLERFYKGLRWKGWREEVNKMAPDHSMSFFPYLWTAFDQIEDLRRKEVPTQEVWQLQMDFREQLLNDKKE